MSKWKYKIKPIKEVKELIKANPDCYIEATYGGGVGYHLMVGTKVLCRISKSSFDVLNNGYTTYEASFINVSNFKVKQS